MNRRWLAADARAHRDALGWVALIVALGVTLVVAAWQTRRVVDAAVPESFAQAELPDAVLWFDGVDEPLRAAAAQQPGVAAAEMRRSLYARISAADGREYPMRLIVAADPLALRIGRLHRHGDASPPADPGLWIEQSGRAMLGIAAGQPLAVRSASGTLVPLPVAGYVHDPSVAPSHQERLVYAWTDPATAARLGFAAPPDQLLLRMAQRGSPADALEFGHRIAAWAKAQQRPALRVEAPAPRHPHALLMLAALRVLGALSLLAFACSAAWAAYMVTLWLRRERRHIGILKTLGARRGRIVGHYAALALPLLLGVSLLALPLGHALARWGIAALAESFNIDLGSAPAAAPWAAPLAAALLLPLLAVTGPLWRAARAPVRQALQDDAAAPALGRRRAKLLRLPGPWRWTLAWRNAFRRPWRLAWIVAALGLGGALLLTTLSNYKSLMGVIDLSLAQQGHDVEVVLQRPAPGAALEAIARAVPGVQRAEAWRRAGVLIGDAAADAARDAADGPDGSRVPLLGYPPGSALFRLPVLEGRRPADDAAGEVLATRSLLAAQPALKLGQPAVLRFGERLARVRIIGLVEQIGPPMLYAPFAGYDAVTGQGDAAGSVRVRGDGGALTPLMRALDAAFLAAQRVPAQVYSRELVRDSLDEHFQVVGQVIRVFAAAAALLGAIGLAAASSLNVLERTREIGVLRALGATPRRIAGVFVAEGALVTLLGAVLAVALSLGLTRLFNRAAERGLLHVAVPQQFSWPGLALVAASALVLVVAIALAVRRVLKLSAREALAYE